MSHFSLHVRAFVSREVQQSSLIKGTVSVLSRPHKRKRPRTPSLTDPSQSDVQFQFLSHDSMVQLHPPLCLQVPLYPYLPGLIPDSTLSRTPLESNESSHMAQADLNLSAHSPHYLHPLLCAPHKMPSLSLPVEWPSIHQGPMPRSFSL